MQHAGAASLVDIRVDAKVYDGVDGQPVEAVRGVAFRLGEGGFTALLGPSGCGKTTILRILAGLDTAFRGQVRWHAPPRIGFVFQEPNLLPWRTVRQNIELTKAASFGAADVGELAGRLGLAPLMNRFPGELSLGLARRVSLARAIASAPSVLLLDEPFASLDDATAMDLRGLLRETRARWQLTTLMVTHNLNEALDLADRLILLSPRPARVLAELPIPPAGHRDAQDIEALRADLMRSHGGLFAQAGQHVEGGRE